MNGKNKISVVINTYNAEKHLDRILSALKGFDEILICDMESTDHTLRIAQEHGCRVVTFERRQHNIVEPAREFAIHEAKYDWVLVVDADELVTPALKAYLYEIIEQDNCPDGLFIPRKNFFMGRFMRCHYPDHVLRFFRKDKTHWPAVIHCVPEVAGRVEKIPGSRKDLALVHLANDTIENIVSKTNLYTRNELERKQHKHYGIMAFFWRPFFRFFKAYILKGAILDGLPGFIKSVLEGYYQFIFLAKKYEQTRQTP